MKKRTWIAALAAVVATALFGVTLDNGFTYSTDADFKVGEWNMHFNALKEKANADNIPLVVFWANPGCGQCNKLEAALSPTNTPVAAWMKKRGYLFCFAYGTSTKDESAAKAFARHATGEFPYIALYWKEEGMTKDPAQIKFVGRTGKMPVKDGDLAAQFMASCEKYLSRYVNYSGGSFGFDESEGDRLEVTVAMTSFDVPLVREADATEALSETLMFVGADGKVITSYPVSWADGETKKTVTVEIPPETFKASGDQASLVLKDAEGNEVESVHVTAVDDTVSSNNPLWIGERSVGGAARSEVEPLQFGEWTMDLDVAMATAEAAEGEAYTLAVIQGSLWCPDCQAVERNFLSLKDGKGVNRFEQWAKDRQVALAVIDVPRFETNTVESTKPTLLSRTAQTGLKSGRGYLTRKGVTDEEAAEVLERNRMLVSTDVLDGGFHIAEDASEFRTGVPCFVLLRKDGSVAARLTQWWSKSPTATEQAKWESFIKRFDEMLAIGATEGQHADATEVANNGAGRGAASFAANGGTATGELSHVDRMDVFRLDGVGGNALQKVSVKGTTALEVNVAFGTADEKGKFVALRTVKGTLSSGIDIDYTFTEAGEYFVRVEAPVNSDGVLVSPLLAIDSATADNFHAYTVKGDVVLVPQEDRTTGSAPVDADTVVVRLEKNVKYRLDGLDATAVPADTLKAEGEGNLCFVALKDGDASLKLAGGNGASLTYQKWVPGSVGFVTAEKTVSETVGEVVVPFERTGGKSGKVTVSIAVNEDETDLYDYWGEPRFDFKDMTFTWKDGEMSATNLVIGIFNDIYYDGTGKLVLDLTITDQANGDTVVTRGKYTLTVTDDEKQKPGRAAFVGADPFFGKKLTVYAKPSTGALVRLGRLEAYDGLVTIAVKASDKTVTLTGEENEDFEPVDAFSGLQTWANRDHDEKAIRVTDLPAAGRTVKLTLSKVPSSAYAPLTASNAVTIVSVAENAPEFKTPVESLMAYRYVNVSATYPLREAPADAARVSFTKLMGTLPAGLKVSYDAEANAMKLAGSPTAKAGVYTVVYQVKEGTLAGLTKELSITIVDPTDVKGAPETANASVATARTLKDLPVVCEDHGLVGTLQLTIPAKGNISAKYLCAKGTIPFTTKSWSEFDPETKALTAILTSTKAGYALAVIAKADGGVEISLEDPAHPDEALMITSNGSVWSAKNPATAWKGYYTAALVATDTVEEREGVAPRGYGYLTLKMDTTSALNAGKMTWAGALPNGTAISGSSVISIDAEKRALVPIFKASSTDVFGILPAVDANAVAEENRASIKPIDGVKTVWTHTDRRPAASFEANFKIYGGYYDKNEHLGGCCEEQYQTTNLLLKFDTSKLAGSGWTAAGAPGTVDDAFVEVGDSTIRLEDGHPSGMSIALTKTTGLVSGKVRIPVGESGKTVSASWKGVIITGWGDGCGCGETSVTLPFMVGAYVFSDSFKDDETGKTVYVKRGSTVEAQVPSVY